MNKTRQSSVYTRVSLNILCHEFLYQFRSDSIFNINILKKWFTKIFMWNDRESICVTHKQKWITHGLSNILWKLFFQGDGQKLNFQMENSNKNDSWNVIYWKVTTQATTFKTELDAMINVWEWPTLKIHLFSLNENIESSRWTHVSSNRKKSD